MRPVLKLFYSHLAALCMGAAITLALVFSAFQFYSTTAERREESLWYLLLDTLHTKSIDLRMRMRGPTLPQTPLAVVGIDERSIRAQGRFPWSRAKISSLLQELFKYDARVVATDIMFSETSNDELQNVLRKIPISSNSPYASQVKTFKEQQLRLSDADGTFAQTIRKNQERVVLSATYDHLEISYQPHQALCHLHVYRKTPFFAAWDDEGYDITTRIEAITEFPEEFTELTPALEGFLDGVLEQIRIKSTVAFCREKYVIDHCLGQLGSKEKDELESAIGMDQREYCGRWLVDGSDEYLSLLHENWPKLKSTEALYEKYSSAEFISGMRTSGLNTAFFPADFWTMSIPALDSATRFTGFLNAHPDSDGTIRKAPLVVRSGEHHLPSLAMRAAMVALGTQQARVNKSQNFANSLQVTGIEFFKDDLSIKKIPVDDQARIVINFAGPGYTFPHISAKELLEPDNPNISVTYRTRDPLTGKIELIKDESRKKSEFLKEKIFIIGGTAIGVYDLRVTPFDENFRGVETHINIIDNILRGDFLSTSNQEPEWMFLALMGLGLTMTIAVSFLGALPGFLIALLLTLAIWLVDRHLIFGQGTVVAIMFPIAITLLIYVGLTIFKYFTEEKKKRQLRGTFEKYVSPAIVNEIMSHPDNIRLGGRKEHMTVFFSDVRGFTSISEALEPEALSALLSQYLTPMTALVFKNNGTLDKYMGDAMMAFFGAPIPSTTHADDACRCALQNLEQLAVLNDQLRARGLTTIDIGIGLNTGPMSVGNMGSETVRSYTVMGDAVNLGSRLEGINKQYGTRIIISEFTEKELSPGFRRREIDRVRVKGKETPVRIFELLGEGSLAPEKEKLLHHFSLGYEFYHAMNWPLAIAEFTCGLQHAPQDSVCELYLARCQDYLQNPPGSSWDGVFTMTTK